MMKNVMTLTLFLMLVVSLASASGVYRNLPVAVAPGEVFDVTLDVQIDNDERFYLFEEIPPETFVVQENSPVFVDKAGHLKEAVFQGVKSRQITYQVQAPMTEGEYMFGGEYSIEGMNGVIPIEGASSITVKNSAFSWLGIIAVALILIVAGEALYLLHKRSKK